MSKSDKYLILVYYVFFIIIGFTFESYNYSFYTAVYNIIVTVLLSFSLFWIIVFVIFPRNLPKEHYLYIILWLLLALFVFGMAEQLLTDAVSENEQDVFYLLTNHPVKLFLSTILNAFLSVAFLVSFYLAKKYFESQIALKKTNEIKKENELRILKSQIDPHFLFNNLNSVDSLIELNPKKAREYIQKLASLYRYLLKTKADEFVTLAEELNFCYDYVYLLEQRFGNTYAFKFEIDAALIQTDKLIPPGAIQTVLENVAKHNIATEAAPIVTAILASENALTITNNIKLLNRTDKVGGTGLKNLKARYSLLTEEELQVIKTSDYFKVILPLINVVN
ncbi:MAG: sensor histidine kinase [Saprospiraceae bacterium]